MALKTGALGLLALAAAQPLLTGRLPWAADTLIHLYRLVELDHLLRHGYVFPRYAPDLAYGFGFPVFNFYAPLSYYAAMLFRLLGMDFAPALLATLAGLILCAALGMYAWATEVWGSRAGLVAAAAYITAPYLLYNVYHRGALAEVLAMALMPLLLWAITRLARQGSVTSFLFTALLYAALLLGHNITALVFTPIIVIYAIILAYHTARTNNHASRVIPSTLLRARFHPFGFTQGEVSRLTLPLALGLGLSAFFWLPAFAERNSVQVIQLFLPQVFDYHYNFVTLSELFSSPVTVDPNLVLPPTPRSIGLIPLGLTVLALAFGWRRWERRQKLVAGFTTALVAGSLFLTLPQSAAIWDTLPLLRFVQFPWRFLGLASLGLAFLAGGLFCHSEPRGGEESPPRKIETLRHYAAQGDIAATVLIAGMIIYGFTWQYVPYLDPVIRPTVADIANYERESGALGTTSAGDYLPNMVKKLPDANALAERYSRADVIERLNPASLPPNAQVIKAHYQPLAADVTIESQSPFTATFDIFHFAGWHASIDDQPVIITPTEPHGLISLIVPAGRHRVQVWFGSTPLRTAAGMVSLASALTLVAASLMFRWSLGPSDRRPQTADGSQPGVVSSLSSAVVCITIVAVITWKTLYLDTGETIFRRTHFDGQSVQGVARSLQVNFDNQMALIGLDPAWPQAELGQKLHVTLYWRALRQLDTDYSISAQLIDERRFVYGQRDSQHPGGYPTSRWKTSDYARDVHEIELAPGTPPGEYRLRVSVYRVGAPSGLGVLDANGAPIGTTFDTAQVVVTRPGRSLWPRPKPAPPKPEYPSGQVLVPGLVLLGYDLPRTQVEAGNKLFFTLYWQMRAAQARDLKVIEVAPISPQFPINRAQPGDTLRGPNSIRIPATMLGGTFTLRLSLIDESEATLGQSVDLGRVTVRVPQRAMTSPSVQHSMRADFGDQIRLIGYDLKFQISTPQKNGGQALKSQIDVVLYWQALREMSSDYKSFVHLLDSTGRLVAGSDVVPANWTRPTTGWIAGEYVADPHPLTLPANLAPGEYRLEVGWYDSETNIRLGTSVFLDQSIRIEP
jgi:hypothetical protein